MQYRVRTLLIVVAMSCSPAWALAGIRPSFDLDRCAWGASHVVVVDSRGEVIESWKGDLPTGVIIPAEHWGISSESTIYYSYSDNIPELVPQNSIRRVTNDRRVFFLIRVGDGDPSGTSSWKPADPIFNDMSVSIAWIVNGQSFAIQQWMNPGPSRMHPLNVTEADMKKEVLRLVEIQNSLRRAIQTTDLSVRAERLVPFLKPTEWLAYRESLKALEKCGQPAWPVIQRLLSQNEHLQIHSDLVFVAADIVGADAIGELERIVRDEILYWNIVASSGERPENFDSRVTAHYTRIGSVLMVLKRFNYRDPEGNVAKLRSQWETAPNLLHMGTSANSRSPVLKFADELLSPTEQKQLTRPANDPFADPPPRPR